MVERRDVLRGTAAFAVSSIVGERESAAKDDDALDLALERFAGTGPEYRGGLANHGPMAAEALVALGRSDAVARWVEGYASRLGPPLSAGDPIPGAVDAVAGLRRAGHSLRFVTNNSTRPRSRLAEELREMGFTLEDDELQTTPGAAARELAGKRVLALVMAAVVPDLDGLELVGHDAEAVLIGGCDETLEPNQVFSYMNLARAFEEIQMNASFYCLHKNKW